MARHVFIYGGYQSADILLWDSFTKSYVPLASPNSASQLVANRQYQVQARVHNTLASSAGVLVDYYEAPGGFGSITTSLSGNGSGLIPANSSILIPAEPGGPPPFSAPPLNQHKCVVVHIRCNIGGEDCLADTVTDPGSDPLLPQCTAWRNCESVSLNAPRKPEPININLTAFGSAPKEPTLLQASAVYVPREWFDTPEVLRATEIMAQSGSTGYPPFLLKSLASTLKPVDLGLHYKAFCHGVKISEAKDQGWHLHTEHGAVPDVVLEGYIPPSSEPGDVYVVKARATYPASKLLWGIGSQALSRSIFPSVISHSRA